MYRSTDGVCAFAGYVIRFSINTELALPDYVALWMQGDAYWRWVSNTLRQGAQPNINAQEYGAHKLPIPPISEQGAIVDCISSLDDSIRSTEQIVRKLELAQLGVVEEILKDLANYKYAGSVAERARKSHVGDEFAIKSGITLGPTRVPDCRPAGYLRVANIQRGRIDATDIAQMESFPGDYPQYEVRVGDLLIVEGHANPHEIGRCALAGSDQEGLLYQNHLFRMRSTTLVPEFSEIWMNSRFVQDYWFRACSSSSGLYTINSKQLAAVPIVVPAPEEQMRIVTQVAAVQGALRRMREQLAKLKHVKQGLMDDLLTGRVRVRTDGELVA